MNYENVINDYENKFLMVEQIESEILALVEKKNEILRKTFNRLEVNGYVLYIIRRKGIKPQYPKVEFQMHKNYPAWSRNAIEHLGHRPFRVFKKVRVAEKKWFEKCFPELTMEVNEDFTCKVTDTEETTYHFDNTDQAWEKFFDKEQHYIGDMK